MALDGDSKVFPVTRALATFGRSMVFRREFGAVPSEATIENGGRIRGAAK